MISKMNKQETLKVTAAFTSPRVRASSSRIASSWGCQSRGLNLNMISKNIKNKTILQRTGTPTAMVPRVFSSRPSTGLNLDQPDDWVRTIFPFKKTVNIKDIMLALNVKSINVFKYTNQTLERLTIEDADWEPWELEHFQFWTHRSSFFCKNTCQPSPDRSQAHPSPCPRSQASWW